MTSNREPYIRFLSTKDYDERTLMIVDHHFWTTNEEELARWLVENTANGLHTREGMMLYFDNKEELSWFLLRWDR